PTTLMQDPELVDEWKREFSAVHIPSILKGLDALMTRDSLMERLSQINVPALVVVGDEDKSLPPYLSRRIHDRLPDSEFVPIPEAGHLSVLEQPDIVNKAILDFLDRKIS
ncbi:MAG: alpha/beta hydrolase, partial [Pyrinomonadaceae bacterium]|nr:alpha/beta hydrolase [Pyrinomonadaceae bacterium]